MNYYNDELDKLDKTESIAIQLNDGIGNKTKHLSLNIESIPVLINWLNEIKRKWYSV